MHQVVRQARGKLQEPKKNNCEAYFHPRSALTLEYPYLKIIRRFRGLPGGSSTQPSSHKPHQFRSVCLSTLIERFQNV
jgi:hypothetical protein